MTTVQIIGVSVAGAALLLLVVTLLVTRHRRKDDEEQTPRVSSFLDEAPQDTFAGLGKAEQPVEDITLDPAVERAAQAARAAETERAAARPDAAAEPEEEAERAAEAERDAATERRRERRQPPPGGLGLDWGPDLTVRERVPERSLAPSWGAEDEPLGEASPDEIGTASGLWPDEPAPPLEPRPDDAEAAAEAPPDEPRADDAAAPAFEAVSPALAPGDDVPPAASEAQGDDVPATAPEAGRPTGKPPAGDAPPAPAAGEPGSVGRLVPLSDIIVTTSRKTVDLQDPEVRRMLTELVTFEIDQATDFREHGQSIDAVLQLTEAEKVSRALGMTESAGRIREMIEEIRRGE